MKPSAGNGPSIAVVGAGAVGCYFGAMLARAGAPVTLIGRHTHMDAIAKNGLLLERADSSERICVATTTGIAAAQDAGIILICVKTVDTESAARSLQPHLAPNSVVLSLQNGVDNPQRMRRAAGIEAMPAVVYVAAAMVAPGHIRHSGRGDLIIGRPSGAVSPGAVADVDTLARTFERAGVPCRISSDIRVELWTKMTLNCAYNAISALGQARYGRMIDSPPVRDLMCKALAETVAVARAEGVMLDEAAMMDAAVRLGEAMTEATSSTAQDIERGRSTEIDSLNGYIARRGVELGVATPVNQVLFTLMKLLEHSPRGQ